METFTIVSLRLNQFLSLKLIYTNMYMEYKCYTYYEYFLCLSITPRGNSSWTAFLRLNLHDFLGKIENVNLEGGILYSCCIPVSKIYATTFYRLHV